MADKTTETTKIETVETPIVETPIVETPVVEKDVNQKIDDLQTQISDLTEKIIDNNELKEKVEDLTSQLTNIQDLFKVTRSIRSLTFEYEGDVIKIRAKIMKTQSTKVEEEWIDLTDKMTDELKAELFKQMEDQLNVA